MNILTSVKKEINKILYGDGSDIILKSIEEQTGRLNPKLKRLSYEYSRDVLGSSEHAKHLYIYCAIQNEFKEGWIPESYYFKKVLPKTKNDYSKLGELNCLQSLLLGTECLPDLAYSINSSLYTTDYGLMKFGDLKNTLSGKNEALVFKPDNSGRGIGVKIIPMKELSENKIKEFGDGVYQSYIKQHPFFNELSHTSVATIRLTTVMDSNFDTSVAGAYLRVGRIFDSHVKADSAIKIPINSKTGELYSKGYMADWKYIFAHPDTGVKFKSKIIPKFDDCKNLSLKLHRKLPYVNCIGWDMIVNKEGNVEIIEWNGYNNDIKFLESTLGPCFKKMSWESL